MKEYKSTHRFQVSRMVVLLLVVQVALFVLLQGGGVSSAASGSEQSANSNATSPDTNCPANGQCFADVLSNNTFFSFVNRIYQQNLVTGYPCGGTGEPCDPQSRPYYRPNNNVTRQQMAKFIDNARRLPEVHIEVNGGTTPIYVRNNTGSAISAYSTSGQALNVQSSTQSAIYAQTGEAAAINGFSTGTTNASYGVYASGHTGMKGVGTANGVEGLSTNFTGVLGISSASYGVEGESTNGTGVGGFGSINGVEGQGDGVGVRGSGNIGIFGYSPNGYGVYGTTDNPFNNWAGYFEGNVYVSGSCCGASAGTYKIDDPTDPTNKYLYQSAVESSDMLGIYRGHVTLDANGEGQVDLPSWFQSLYGDFDYQLTCVGGYAPVYISREIENNRFEIAGGKPGLKVSWQVTGVRHDPYAQQHPIPTQQDKPAGEQGTYLHPELYGQTGK